MPLIVGIGNEEKRKLFTESERHMLASFTMGTLAMGTGIGHIANGKKKTYGTVISVEQATERFTAALQVYGIQDMHDDIGSDKDFEPTPFSVLTDQAFVQRMADAGWSCNVVNKSEEEWAYHAAQYMLENAWRRAGLKRPPSLDYQRVEKSRELIHRMAKAEMLDDIEYYGYMNDHQALDLYIERYMRYDFDEPFMYLDGEAQYLHWSDEFGRYLLRDTPEEE